MRAVLFLCKPGVSVWVEWLGPGLGWGRAVDGEAASGKRGLSTLPGTSAPGADRRHLCRWDGVGTGAAVDVHFKKKKRWMRC